MTTSIASKLPSKNLSRLFLFTPRTPFSQPLCTLTKPSEAQPQTQKLEKVADELLSLSKLERYDFSILMRHKMGLNRYGPAAAGLQSGSVSTGPATEVKAATEKLVFDVKLEIFEAAAKIKIIKEVRAFTDLGLKDAKDLVERVPIVVKKGLTKDEAEAISEKLKALGATVVLKQSAVDYIKSFDIASHPIPPREQLQQQFCEKIHPEQYHCLFKYTSVKNVVADTDIPSGCDVESSEFDLQPGVKPKIGAGDRDETVTELLQKLS